MFTPVLIPVFPAAREGTIKSDPPTHLTNICTRHMTSGGKPFIYEPWAEIASDSRLLKQRSSHTDTALRSASGSEIVHRDSKKRNKLGYTLR